MRHLLVTLVLLVVGAIASSGCPEVFAIGEPCTPEQEYDPSFGGFDLAESTTESNSYQCRTRLCLVNHFRGRVSCPYGAACKVPGTTTSIDAKVPPQCVDRPAKSAVYCSCRCADINGDRPSDQRFCSCPDGFRCEPLVTSIGRGNEGLTGSYCLKQGTTYDPNTACTGGECDPDTRKCD
jgi:hypothetical protein